METVVNVAIVGLGWWGKKLAQAIGGQFTDHTRIEPDKELFRNQSHRPYPAAGLAFNHSAGS